MNVYRVEHRGLSRFVGDAEKVLKSLHPAARRGSYDLVHDHPLIPDQRFVVAPCAVAAAAYASALAVASVVVPETHRAEWTLETLLCVYEGVVVVPTPKER